MDEERELDPKELSRLAAKVASRLGHAKGKRLYPRDVRCGDRWLAWHNKPEFTARMVSNDRVIDTDREGVKGEAVRNVQEEVLSHSRRFVWKTK